MNPELRRRLTIQLIRHEGKQNTLYEVNGIPHIGIGHNLRFPISDAAVAQIFRDDLGAVVDEVQKRLPWMLTLTSARQAVLYDMAFNMGVTGLLHFPLMLEALQAHDYRAAARELLDSTYAGQVGHRATELALQLETGGWPA